MDILADPDSADGAAKINPLTEALLFSVEMKRDHFPPYEEAPEFLLPGNRLELVANIGRIERPKLRIHLES